jgi:hypothetical protein
LVFQRHSSVRVVDSRWRSRAAYTSVLIATGVAFIAFLGWRVWRAGGSERPAVRDLGTIWKCPAGHRFPAAGQREPRRCMYCDRIAHPVQMLRCPEHGPVEVFLKFGPKYRSDDQRDLYLSLDHENWVPRTEGIRCPQCGRLLQLPQRDPLPFLSHNRENR